jgi:hypothetical protein
MDIIETRLSAIEDIKLRALYIEKRFMSNDPEETMQAESKLAALQYRFCDENRDFITPPMAGAVKKDFNTFLALIEWASDYYKKAGTGSTGYGLCVPPRA